MPGAKMNKFSYMLMTLTINTGKNCCGEKGEEQHLLKHQKQRWRNDREN